ncbi:MAG: inositol monophosphatase [Gammaproteobacteria bacterium]|nr:inositol monophosphatase [Gammaproteobacteria bacterium]
MQPMTNIAVRAARAAGKIQMQYLNRLDTLTVAKKGRNDFVSEVDRACEQEIIQILKAAYPGHGVLAEETGTQQGNEYQWIIDPLDGTTNYLHGFPQFAVSIACRHRGELISGVVYDPFKDEMFTADKGGGAYLNDRRLRVSNRKSLDGALIGTGFPFRDHTHLDTYTEMFKAMISETAGLRRPGSAALDFAYVAAGRLDGFWEIGLSIWDFAAGALMVREAGGTVSDLAGGDKHLQTGNVIAGPLKVHTDMVRLLRPFLHADLRA